MTAVLFAVAVGAFSVFVGSLLALVRWGVEHPADDGWLLHDQLVRAAADRDLSVDWLVNAAVKDFLARLLPADEIRPTGDSTGGEA